MNMHETSLDSSPLNSGLVAFLSGLESRLAWNMHVLISCMKRARSDIDSCMFQTMHLIMRLFPIMLKNLPIMLFFYARKVHLLFFDC